MTPLLAHDHSELDELLARVFTALEAGKIGQSFERLDIFWARLAMHIRAEHLQLFPAMLRAFETPEQTKKSNRAPTLETVKCTIAQLRADHDFFMNELTAAIKQLRGLRESPGQAESSLLANVHKKIAAVSERLHVHNELEESAVYQWTEALLEPAERVALNERMQKELDNVPARLGASERRSW